MLTRELPGGYALRLLEESDADELFAVIDANREHLGAWMPWVDNEHQPDDVLPFIRRTRRQIADNDGLQTAIVDPEDRIVGMVGFHGVDWMNRRTSIGYWLARDEQGRGTATHAVRALLDLAFGTWRLNRVAIEAAVDNARSRAVAQRLGFTEEGVLREAERVGERRLDHVVYAMLAADWPAASGPPRGGPLAGDVSASGGVGA
jgi:ribosomal-protein-serine acetyltransferase